MYCTIDNKWKTIYTFITLYLMAYYFSNCMNNQKVAQELVYNQTYLNIFGILLLSLVVTSILSFSFKKIPSDERHTEINKFITLFFIGTIVFISQRNLFLKGLKNDKEIRSNTIKLAKGIISNKNSIQKLKGK